MRESLQCQCPVGFRVDFQGFLSRIPGRIEEMHGKVERMPPKGIGLFGPKDALYYYVQGGGGWGDPIEREPDKVAWDYRNGLVSVDCAKGSYGVVLDEKTGEVIQDKTIELRGSMTAERLD